MDQRQQKFFNIIDSLFFNAQINVLNTKAASFTTSSLHGVSLENLKELAKRLGTENIDVLGVKDNVTIVVKNLPSSQKWKGFKAKKA